MPLATYFVRPRSLIFVDEMTTIDQLRDEIRVLEEENVEYKKQFAELIQKGNDKVTVALINFFNNRISETNLLILEIVKQITAVKARGETTASPITFRF